jgi:hypothetical protein
MRGRQRRGMRREMEQDMIDETPGRFQESAVTGCDTLWTSEIRPQREELHHMGSQAWASRWIKMRGQRRRVL